MQPTKRLCSKAPNKVHGVTFVEDTMEDDGERLVSTLPPPPAPFLPVSLLLEDHQWNLK